MGYRDLIPAIEWDEDGEIGAALVPGIGDAWYSQGGIYSGTAAPNGWFQVGGAADAVFAWINGFVFGSHVKRDEKVMLALPAVGAPGDMVRLRATMDWSYYAWAVMPSIRVYAYLNGVPIKNLPAGFTYEDGWPTVFEIDAALDGSGNATLEFGIYHDDGIGSASLNATLTVQGLYALKAHHRLLFPYPPEDVRSYRRPLPGSQRITLPSGESDAWLLGHAGIWSCEARWIPAVTALALPDNDGWEDVDDSGTPRAGWDRFLRHARSGGAFTLYPDKDDPLTSYPCVWDEASSPLPPELEDDMVRLERLTFRTTNGALIAGYSQ